MSNKDGIYNSSSEEETLVAMGVILTAPLEQVPAIKRAILELGGRIRYYKLSPGRLSIVEMDQENGGSRSAADQTNARR